MTSDSITEQAARVLRDLDRQFADAFAQWVNDEDPESARNPPPVAPSNEDRYRALAAAGLLMNEAPATEDGITPERVARVRARADEIGLAATVEGWCEHYAPPSECVDCPKVLAAGGVTTVVRAADLDTLPVGSVWAVNYEPGDLPDLVVETAGWLLYPDRSRYEFTDGDVLTRFRPASSPQAPATEDEAAEVEYAVREPDGSVAGMNGISSEVVSGYASTPGRALVSHTVHYGPWREVSR